METRKTNSTVTAVLAVLLAFVCAGMSFAQEDVNNEDDETPFIVEIKNNETHLSTEIKNDETPLSKERKNAITLDTMALFKGFIASDNNTNTLFFNISLGYERLLFSHYSVGAELYLIPGKFYDNNYMFFGIAATGRYYPLSKDMKKLFLGAILGFNMQFVDGKLKAENGGFAGLYAGVNAGYKHHLTDMFFVEPSVSYTYSKTNLDFYGMTPVNYGLQVSLRAGVSF